MAAGSKDVVSRFASPEKRFLDWQNNVGAWIEACLEDRGVPTFRTKYSSEINGVVVTGVCHGGDNKVGTVYFVNVPKSDLALIDRTIGEWRIFRRKYGPKRDP